MKYSMGIWDRLFGEKVVLEIPDASGNIIKKKVTSRWFKHMQALEKVSLIPTVCVHILDPLIPEPTTAYYRIGEEITQEQVDKFLDSKTQAIYALIVYSNGEPRMYLVIKPVWDETKRAMESV